MNIIKYSVGIFAINCFFYSFGQSKNVVYEFVIKDKIFIDSLQQDYIGKEFEFIYERNYLNDSAFEEKNLFSNDSFERFIFLIKEKKWYYMHKKKWYLFFDQGNKTDCVFYLDKIPFKLSWEKSCNWDRNETFMLKLIPPEEISISHLPIYFFNPNYGIIGIKNTLFLIRKDLIGNETIH